ncbi:nucleotidyltransferase family protein [Parabacteroides acidifaciens]|jgi:predicted nucleotidyltransferase|uniref:Nucleotidyltransferase n=1 Tax=Parabacteroides acidifaciens TaxID=2290935 RepID=A0A3D8HHY3_9BACT|nr:nucleotidyltransferase family protein [Parabacteroides acidifaciens]MBC8600765.1 nucleotidyltransferase family protein [Parabacteroides acidifaciens]RDU50589.1 nucleotidyltransferase [Parabacteroides acidifaciens]
MKDYNYYIALLKQFKSKFAGKYGILKIGIFGSVARGEQKEGSDLDIFVELKEADPYLMFDLQSDLEKLCNCSIDLIRLRKSLRPLLLNKIKEEGIYA